MIAAGDPYAHCYSSARAAPGPAAVPALSVVRGDAADEVESEQVDGDRACDEAEATVGIRLRRE